MNRLLRKPLFLLTALPVLLASLPVLFAQSAPRAKTFRRNQMEISAIRFAGKNAFLSARNAIYSANLDLMHWRAIDTLVGKDFCGIAGGTTDHLFLLKHGPINSNTHQLLEWNRATGALAEIRRIPSQGDCHFLDDKNGAYLLGSAVPTEDFKNLCITTDGGKNWTSHLDILSPRDRNQDARCILWIDAHHIVVGGDASIASFAIDDAGIFSRQWISLIEPFAVHMSRGPEIEKHPTIWVNTGSSAVQVDAATGKKLATVDPHFPFNVATQIGDDLWIAGETDAAIYRAEAAGKFVLIKKFGYPGVSSSSSTDRNGKVTPAPPAGWVQWILPDKSGAALLIGIDGQVYRWDGKADTLTASAFEIDTSVIDKTQATADAKEVSAEQMREMISYIGKIPQARFGDVLEAKEARQKAEHLTNREAMAWELVQLKQILADQAANPELLLAAARAPTGYFGGSVEDLRVFSATSAIAITTYGLFTTDGSFNRWKAVTPWKKPQSFKIAGGTDKNLYLVSSANKEVIVKEGYDPPPGHEHDNSLRRTTKRGKAYLTRYEYTFTLYRWTPEAGLTELRKLPAGADYASSPAPCEFISETTGGFIDGRKFFLTRDGAKTWIESPLQLLKNGAGVLQFTFCGSDKIAVTDGSDDLAFFQIDKEGRPQRVWDVPLFGRYGEGFSAMLYDSVDKLLWVHTVSAAGEGSAMQGFDLTDGHVVQQFQPFGKGEWISSCSISGTHLAATGTVPKIGTVLRIFDLAATHLTPTAEISVERNSQSLDAAYFIPSTKDVYLLLRHDTLVQWDGKPMLPAILPSRIKHPFIDHALFDHVEDTWPPGDGPTRKESAACSAAERALSPQQFRELFAELQKKRDDFANSREQTLWMTRRALELKAAPAATRP